MAFPSERERSPQPGVVAGSVMSCDIESDFNDQPSSAKYTSQPNNGLTSDDDELELDNFDCEQLRNEEHNKNTVSDKHVPRFPSNTENGHAGLVDSSSWSFSSTDDEDRSNACHSASTSQPDLHIQIREQLDLLKMGKRKDSFLAESSIFVGSHTSISQSLKMQTVDETSNVILEKTNTTIQKGYLQLIPVAESPKSPTRRNSIDNNEQSTSDSENFFGFTCLSQSFNSTTPTATTTGISQRARSETTSVATPKLSVTVNQTDTLAANAAVSAKRETTTKLSATLSVLPKSTVNVAATDAITNRTNTFVTIKLSRIVDTTAKSVTAVAVDVLPYMRRSDAFVGNALGTKMKETRKSIHLSALPQNIDTAHANKPVINAALVTDTSHPPLFARPVRSLLTKRTIKMTQNRRRHPDENADDINKRMLDNASYIRQAVKRRTSNSIGIVHMQAAYISAMLKQRVPFTRDIWRTASWLCTSPGRYYYQTVITDSGAEVSLPGGCGNYAERFAWRMKSGQVSQTSKVLIDADKRPPACVEFDDDLGPTVQLEVWPQVNRPLPEHVRTCLKMLAPTDCITEQYAQFAVSTFCAVAPAATPVELMKTRRGRLVRRSCYNESAKGWKKEIDVMPSIMVESVLTSFEQPGICFDIPNANDQTRLLGRRRNSQLSVSELQNFDEGLNHAEKLQFDRHVRVDDALALQVAQVLHDMMEAVFMSSIEKSVVRDDPDDGSFEEMISVREVSAKMKITVAHRAETVLQRDLKLLDPPLVDYEPPVEGLCYVFYSNISHMIPI